MSAAVKVYLLLDCVLCFQAPVEGAGDHCEQHVGSLPAGAAVRLRSGGGPSYLLEQLEEGPPPRLHLLQARQAQRREGRGRGES